MDKQMYNQSQQGKAKLNIIDQITCMQHSSLPQPREAIEVPMDFRNHHYRQAGLHYIAIRE
jgi:hypothetical protein